MKPSFRALLLLLQHIIAVPLASPVNFSDTSGEKWIGLCGGDPSSIPADTALAQHEDWPVDDADGSQQTPESKRGGVWSSAQKAFLAYGVDLRGVAEEETKSWVHSAFLDESEYLHPSDRDRIVPELATKIQKDLSVANSILTTLHRRGGLPNGTVNRWYTGVELKSVVGATEVKRELRRARHVMDERCAAINLGILRSEDRTQAYVKNKFSPYIKKWKLLTKMRGLYIDFRHFDPHTISVLEMLKHRVPVFYPLDPQFLPSFSAEETRDAELVVTLEDYMHWFTLPEYWPAVDKSKPAPVVMHGFTADELATWSEPIPNRLARLDDLAMHARFILADTLGLDGDPVVNRLGDVSVAVVGAARLLVDPLSELRMMLWAVSSRSSNISEVLGEALLRGWAFRVVYPKDHLYDLAREEPYVSAIVDHPLSPIIVLAASEVLDAHVEWLRFLERLRILLSRPHAKMFLLLGGIYWRLAILFGADYMQKWKEDVLAPSVTLVQRGVGREDIPGYWRDEITAVEKDILIGLVHSKSSSKAHTWFPPQDLLVKHGFDKGEWSLDEERLVMDRYTSLQNGESCYRPLSLEDWDEELSRYKIGRLARISFVSPHPLAVDALLVDSRTEFRGSWNRAELGAINAPMDFENEDWFDD